LLGPGGTGYEALPGAGEAPLQPMPMGVRTQASRVAPVVSSQSPSYRSSTVGTGVTPSAKGGSVKLAQPASTRKPSSGLQPTLIGPLGYDDLR
jgi:hypothetical protein